MAKVKIQGNASGSAVYTVQTSAGSVDKTITLPDATGTLINTAPSTSGNILTSDGTDWTSAAAAAGGKVLQVISTTKKDTFSSSSSSFVDITGLSVSITPSLTTSKILVFGVTYMGNLSGDMTTKIVRGSTDIVLGDADGSRRRATTSGSLRQTYESLAHPFNFLDEPSTQSATTYKIQAVGGGTWYINRTDNNNDNTGHERVVSTITVMEIGA
jgi:hypothetical protein